MNDFREWLSDNLRYFMLGGGIILLALLIFFGVRIISGLSKEESIDKRGVATENTQKKEEATKEVEKKKEEANPSESLAENKEDELASLMNKYYMAMGNKDIDTVRACVDNLSAEDEKLITDPLYIEGFSDIQVHSIKGYEKDSYLVFVSYKMKLKNIETLYPAMNHNYVSRKADGSFYIVTAALNAEQEAYVGESLTRQDIQALIESVEKAEAEAIGKDAALANFVKELGYTNSDAMNAENGSIVTVAVSCNVRALADTSSDSLGTVEAGSQFTKTGQDKEWVAIDYNGVTGYIRGDLLK